MWASLNVSVSELGYVRRMREGSVLRRGCGCGGGVWLSQVYVRDCTYSCLLTRGEGRVVWQGVGCQPGTEGRGGGGVGLRDR